MSNKPPNLREILGKLEEDLSSFLKELVPSQGNYKTKTLKGIQDLGRYFSQ